MSSDDRRENSERPSNQTAPFQVNDLNKIERNAIQEGWEDKKPTAELSFNNESVNLETRYLTEIRNPLKRFTISLMGRTNDKDELTVHEAVTGCNALKWETAMNEDIDILENMKR